MNTPNANPTLALTGPAAEGMSSPQAARHNAKPRPRKGREPLYKLDTDGAAIVLVPTDRPGRPVKAFATDWHAYLARGNSPFLFLNSDGKGRNYARVARPGTGGRPASVLRLMLDVSDDCGTRFIDGDPLNLRRDNIVITRRKPRAATIPNGAN